MKVTTTPTKKGRVNVFADGEYAFTVPYLIWKTSGIGEGSELTPETAERLKEAGYNEDAYEKALELLSYRAHSSKELTAKLRVRFSQTAAVNAVERCLGNGLINDESFARSYAEELVRRRGFSEKRIFSELLNKGIDRETARLTVEALDIDKETGILQTLEKMDLPEVPDRKQTDRAVRRLLRLGYSYAEIRRCLNRRGVGTADVGYEDDC